MTKYNIVTACDVGYLPGVIALYNSIQKHSTMYDFHVILHGPKWHFDVLESHPKINCIYDQQLETNPTSSHWPDEIPAMYSRILIPSLFESQYEKSLWLDADTIVQADLADLFAWDLTDYPVGASLNGNPWNVAKQKLARELEFHGYDIDLSNINSAQAGVLVFNNKEWNRLDLTNKFIDVTRDSNVVGKYVVQSYMNYVLMGNFQVLPFQWNVDVSWKHMCVEGAQSKILHFIGGGKKAPWREGSDYTWEGIDYIPIWKSYFNEGKIIT